ncbi:MFS transporter [Acinetobacter pittii]|uniref:MFS transporter n=1 Tax=Acinetobacter pittii TaxID=48296 RepID=UPI001EFCCE4D|nr:MFS transporter [Acinetobacter pittii]MCG9494210.1 MFS transporter [Acinetobacter pittii]
MMKLRELKPVLILGLCAFVMILAEFIPISLLTNIANTLKTEPSIIGVTVSIYATIGATSGIIFTLILNKFNRKKLFLLIFTILFIGNTLIIYSENIFNFFILRSLCAIGHGIFWAVVADFSIKIVSIELRGIASSIIFSSIPIATIVGLPILNYIGNQFNWYLAFSLISTFSVICFLLIIFFIPNIDTEFKNEPIVFKKLFINKLSWILVLITGTVSIAHFCSYTYIEPYIRTLTFFSKQNLVIILIVFGLSGVIGNIITIKFMNNFIERISLIFLILMSFSLLFLFLFGCKINFYTCLIFVFIWGISISILFTSLQTWVIIVSEKNSAVMSAFNSAILNYSIGIGSILGAYIISNYNIILIFLASSFFLFLGIMQLTYTLITFPKNHRN